MSRKKMVLTLYRQNHVRSDWRVDLAGCEYELFFVELAEKLGQLGIELEIANNDEVTIDINSYADLMNAIRISSPSDGFANICIGHVIGKSPNLDLMEDIKRGVNRVAFAPETIPPEDHNRRVCHNCGCGC
jgi:hypothetical protein